MPNLSRFLAFAGRADAVAPVAPASKAGATSAFKVKHQSHQTLEQGVAPVAPVAPESDDAWNDADWQAAFDERAGILEYDEGLPRAEAERLAREQVDKQRRDSVLNTLK